MLRSLPAACHGVAAHPPAAGQKGDRETPQEVSRHAQAELEQLEVARHRVCVLMSILTTMVAQGEYF